MSGYLIYVCPECGKGMTCWDWWVCRECQEGRYWGGMA
jgi:hypothetical protein